MVCCPDGPSYLMCAETWMQASGATSDYFNTCGFMGPATTPFPDGDGAAGFICMQEYSEFIGACLTEPMYSGNLYQMQFNLAFNFIDPYGTIVNSNIPDLPPIEMVIYGTDLCSDLPFDSFSECPIGFGNWHVLGSVFVSPQDIYDTWGVYNIEFTTNTNINAIILGPACDYPIGGEYDQGCDDFGWCDYMPYFFIDNLLLNESAYFGIPITTTGQFCENNLVITADSDSIGTYQWYYEGIALVGETGQTLNVSANAYSEGLYQLLFTNENGCGISETLISGLFPDLDGLPDQTVCGAYALPDITGTNLSGNQYYCSGPNGTGEIYLNDITNSQIVYIYDANEGCYDEESFYVTITNEHEVNDLNDVVVCDGYALPAITGVNLSGSQNYYNGPGGQGGIVTSPVTNSQKVYIYDALDACIDEESFEVTVHYTPVIYNIPDQTICGFYELPPISGYHLSGNENYYTEPNGGGEVVSSPLTETQTIYIYDESWTCIDEESFTIDITSEHEVDDIPDQVVCGSFPLPDITGLNLSGNEYFCTGPNGSGSILSSQIVNSMTVYIYDMNGNCEDEQSFYVEVIESPNITDLPDVSICGSYNFPTIGGTNLTGNQNFYSEPGGEGQILVSPITESQTVYMYDVNGDCESEESFFVEITNIHSVDDIADTLVCNEFYLPAITGENLSGDENFYTGPGGTGEILASPVNLSQTVYIYDINGICEDEQSFELTIVNGPVIDELDDQFVCNTFTLPEITGEFLTGNEAYYNSSGGVDLISETEITESQIVYIYDQAATCSDETSFYIEVIHDITTYAGEDQIVCGNVANLAATYSYEESSGLWSGPGMFSDIDSDQTTVSVSPGEFEFVWHESLGSCSGTDTITVRFVEEPLPFILTEFDTICNTTYTLEVLNSNYPGYWTAYNSEDNSVLNPQPMFFPFNTSSSSQVSIGNFDGEALIVDFVWTEINQAGMVSCTSEAVTQVVFAKQPIASVGPDDEAEVCGNYFTGLNADITGSEWADGLWISSFVSCNFDDATNPNTEVTFNELGIYGDSAFVLVPLYWTMSNYNCQDIDTMWLNMYQQPIANAGLDHADCGLDSELQAFYNIGQSVNYIPSGTWSVSSGQGDQIADIDNTNLDATTLSVYDYGIWEFAWRENNSLNTSCYDVDTVMIEFLETPIVSAGEDQDICGKYAQLNATSGGNPGGWIITPGVSFNDYTNPNDSIEVSYYGEIGFSWIETNASTISTLTCSAIDEVIYTFWPQPEADILTDSEDNYTCGFIFDNLRSENPGTGITGYWYNESPSTVYGDVFSNDTWVQVSSYDCYDFYWIEQSGPLSNPGFCNDTAGPLNICFYEIPVADAGIDTLFCGLTGELSAIPSVGTGVWTTPSELNINVVEIHNPNSIITSEFYNTDPGNEESYTIQWTEDNNGCTDSETVEVVFARIPDSDIIIIPPKCFGEQAIIAAEDSVHVHYSWNYYGGDIINSLQNNLGGNYQNFVSWDNNAGEHIISLMVTSEWGCLSPIKIDTIYEPEVPDFDYTIVSDTCLFSKGGVLINDTTDISYFWLDENYGPEPGTIIVDVLGIPLGTYAILSSYLTQNEENYAYYIQTFGSAYCTDTILFEVESIGMLNAEIELLTNNMNEVLVAPEANAVFMNLSQLDNVPGRCEWHFDDGEINKSCDDIIEHIYKTAGCYSPYLVIYNKNLPECRDTAYLEYCIPVESSSFIEIPNIFSPNNDGYNDYFQVRAQTLTSFSGTIVNRWGRKIYTWDNWLDYEAGWDGRLSGGTQASPGVYYYIIRAVGYDGEEYEYTGALQLVGK